MGFPNFTKQPLAKNNIFCYRCFFMNAILNPPPVLTAAKPRGRPRKTLEEREDGNRKGDLIAAAAKACAAARPSTISKAKVICCTR
jgi:hypothetical protein